MYASDVLLKDVYLSGKDPTVVFPKPFLQPTLTADRTRMVWRGEKMLFFDYLNA